MMWLLGLIKTQRLVIGLIFIIIAISGYTLYFYEKSKTASYKSEIEKLSFELTKCKEAINSLKLSCEHEKKILNEECKKQIDICQERLKRCQSLQDILNEIEELK